MFEKISKIALQFIIYTALLLATNMVTMNWSIIVPINLVTILVATIFKIPGIIALVLIKMYAI